MRISRLQSDVLVALAALESRNITSVSRTDLLNIINSVRETPVFAVALRASMETLRRHGLTRTTKNMKTNKLSYSITGEGRALGIDITVQREREKAVENE
ncbi:hypothetical protein L5M38_20470 [Shewanella sp. SM101]|jgi:hypothetical protein|uniref:hypothetical protein n=1 Tax=Shewanella TaxID=22 RepID=UPI0002112D88|nr:MULTISPECIES: hypothetical protein [Shewanella]AEH16223.1 hypothetical protein Sbal117_4585 [Shewanella baltica OS117]MCU8106897.1 hypothetical protein [Shewanella sp. SM101]